MNIEQQIAIAHRIGLRNCAVVVWVDHKIERAVLRLIHNGGSYRAMMTRLKRVIGPSIDPDTLTQGVQKHWVKETGKPMSRSVRSK